MINFAKHIGNFFLPPLCAACRAPLMEHENLCPACWSDIEFISPPICDVLGIPLPFDPGGVTVSAGALAAPPDYNRARAVARYTGVVRRLIHALKYADQHDSWRLYGRWMRNAADDLLRDTDLLVPVPLNRRRLWSRRFNQSAILSNALSLETGLKAEHFVLARNRATRSQVGLSLSQRRRNVSGAFTVSPKWHAKLKGANILLVDDVITTGATVDACARALKQAGAARIDIIALARVTDNDLVSI